MGAVGSADLARVLGEDPPPPVAEAEADVPQSQRFKLIGVLSPPASRAQRDGVALIAIDDQPAKAYRIGASVEGDTVLQAVQPRGAVLGTRGGVALVSLQLPPPAAPATGTLTTAGAPDLGALSAPSATLPPPMPGDKGLPRRPGASLPVVQVPMSQQRQRPIVQTPQSVLQTHMAQPHVGAQSGVDESNHDDPTPGGLPAQ